MNGTIEMSEDEYLVREPQSEYRHEYRQGRMIAMSGSSLEHALIASNVIYSIRSRLGHKSCMVFGNDIRLKVAAARFHTYPDVSAVCGKAELDEKDRYALVNLQLIIEILSPSTEAYDRGEKFEYFKKLASLQEYVLVAQDRARVEWFTRSGSEWVGHLANRLDATVHLASIGIDLPVHEIYEKVELSE